MPTSDEAIRREGPLWFPGTAERLVADFNSTMFNSAPARYTTATCLGLDRPKPSFCGTLKIADRRAALENLQAFAPSQIAVTTVPWRPDDEAALASAISLLDKVPRLTSTLAALIRAVHRLAADSAFDVSHSEPKLPYTIFLSIPPPGPTRAPRLAESILHEAMHLQLSLIERTCDLVSDHRSCGWSPWQCQARPAQGLLHGLYVFSVIFEVSGQLSRATKTSGPGVSRDPDEADVLTYFQRRRRQISAEISELAVIDRALSPIGQQLWRRCLAVVSTL